MDDEWREVTRVIICDTCAVAGEAPQGEAFAQALRGRVGEGVCVETTSCMNQCDTPVSLALRSEGKDVYLFHSVDPARDLDDTLALIELYRTAEGGTIEDARPAGRLRHCLSGRVPK
ncbi:putative metal-binding protein [Planktotalea frisia]|uniref:Metal-binding protein n=1 Tax=Planktotalea frisia TaxID=696762 RepID=A0A1L9NXE3_9RHOB|nr:DUF1636 family protein [Planktotalea frisia]OJI93937.1 hypothetical protein PFRI_18380 [Planktotalea frisia]PZX35262.1 putative metal-binding protein [Planktotalea frisia]